MSVVAQTSRVENTAVGTQISNGEGSSEISHQEITNRSIKAHHQILQAVSSRYVTKSNFFELTFTVFSQQKHNSDMQNLTGVVQNLVNGIESLKQNQQNLVNEIESIKQMQRERSERHRIARERAQQQQIDQQLQFDQPPPQLNQQQPMAQNQELDPDCAQLWNEFDMVQRSSMLTEACTSTFGPSTSLDTSQFPEIYPFSNDGNILNVV